MNKLVLLGIFIIFNSNPTPNFIKEFNNLKGEKSDLIFIKKYENSTKICVEAYVVAVKMRQAKYKWNPIKKMAILNKYKNQLDSLIVQYPKNIHLRYVRLLIQEKAPKILGYNKNITEDKKILQIEMKQKDSTDYLDKYIFKNTSL
ncbi:MAG TPA: hypothetical protein ENK67_06800 [Flavobacteriia bacterium]|nr:hypothetical protein [Flavobacteriia bacterium]